MLAKNKQTRETFSIKAIIPTDCMYNRNTMSAKRMEENYINISTPCEGVEAVVRQCMCVNDLKIKTPAQVPEYSYLLPTCHSPDLLTSPCRCSSPRLCHTCSGTPETLHTDTHETTQWADVYIQTDPSPDSEQMSSEYLLLDEACSWHTKWHWIWTRLSPACFLQQHTVPEKSQRTSVCECQIRSTPTAVGSKQTSPERPV